MMNAFGRAGVAIARLGVALTADGTRVGTGMVAAATVVAAAMVRIAWEIMSIPKTADALG
jgi:hypothetical protein